MGKFRGQKISQITLLFWRKNNVTSRHGAFNPLPSYNDNNKHKAGEVPMKERTKVIVDDTTIYEVDLACYESLTPEEKRKYFPQAWKEERGSIGRNHSFQTNRK